MDRVRGWQPPPTAGFKGILGRCGKGTKSPGMDSMGLAGASEVRTWGSMGSADEEDWGVLWGWSLSRVGEPKPSERALFGCLRQIMGSLFSRNFGWVPGGQSYIWDGTGTTVSHRGLW